MINSKQNKVSFLTTVFSNNSQYLNNFFESLKNQTFTDFDVIVVNDGYEEFEDLKKNLSKV